MNLKTLSARLLQILDMLWGSGQLPVIIESEDGTETFTPLSVRVDSKAGVFISIQTKKKEAEKRYGNDQGVADAVVR